MNNVWKGLFVGGLTGVAAGFALDSLTRTSDKAKNLGKQVADRAPDAGKWVHSVTENTRELLRDSDLPERLREAAQKVKDSDVARQVSKI
jgi:hypothetical protein